MEDQVKRFDDEGAYLGSFGHRVLGACPRCTKPVWVSYEASQGNSAVVPPFACTGCGYIRDGYTIDIWKQPFRIFSRDFDLYLKIDCCGHTLWAYNPEHLQFLEDYVAAKLRVRQPNINKSLVSRLPQWMKDANNRKPVLRAIARLKENLEHDLRNR